MRCVTCGVELLAGKPFCHACGTRVASHCGSCGAILQMGWRFCPDCGASVDGGAAAPADSVARVLARRRDAGGPTVVAAAGPVEGERKVVSVLFCDLVGSTSIADRLDPEDFHELIEQYLDVAVSEVYRRGGVVTQLAGDGVMALFGAPVAHEDAPHRAVRTALAIRDAVEALSQRLRARHDAGLQLRIGVNTGPVVVGTVGNDRRMEYTAIGDTTNLAARLEAAAEPGVILISESTHRLVRGHFEVEPIGQLELRGKSEPVSAYAVRDWRGPAAAMSIAEARGLTPFVGRVGELARLEDAYQRLGDGGMQVIAVVGDAGSGKSRLVHEFRQRLAGEPLALFEGRCASMLHGLPYHPFLSMMGTWFELDWEDDTDVACEKVSRRFGVPYEEVERTYPVLCRFLSLPIEDLADQPADQLKRETFDAVARLIMGEAARRPVVIVLEDLHWIDEPSRELLEDLMRRLAGAHVLVVLTHRPETAPTFQITTAFAQILLRRLDDADICRIAEAVAGGTLPPDLVPVLVAKAAGSPFFAEELVRGMCEDGTLLCEDGTVRHTRALREMPIPGTIQEVIAARLDRLGAGAKRIVQVAAVLGRQFRRSQLEELLAGEQLDVPRELEELERRGLLHRKNLLAADEFRFGESLTQEIAYETLLLRQRRQLHERIGRMLEAEDADRPAEHAALLAHHYAHSDDHVKAVESLLRAAVEAERLPSYRVASQYYRQAWQLAESVLGEREDGHFHRAALAGASGFARLTVFFGGDDVCEAQRAAGRGTELAEMLGQQAEVATLRYFRGVLAIMGPEADYQTGLQMAEEGLALARRLNLRDVVHRIVRGVAMNYTADGRFAQAEAAVLETLADLERDGATRGEMYLSTLWVRDMTRYASDRWDEVLENGYHTNALAMESGNRTMRTAMATLFAPIHYLRGDYHEAQRWADLGLELAEQIANVNAYATSASLAMLTRTRLGEPFDPAPYVDRIEKGLAAAGTMQLNTRFVGEALLAIGDVDRADRITAGLVGRLGGRLRQLLVLLARGDVLVRRGRLGEAAGCFAEARNLAEQIGSRSGLVGALLGCAEVALARGTVPCGIERAAELADELRIVHLAPRLAAARSAAPELRGA